MSQPGKVEAGASVLVIHYVRGKQVRELGTVTAVHSDGLIVETATEEFEFDENGNAWKDDCSGLYNRIKAWVEI